MIAVDTNLLVYAHRAGTPEHRAAKKAIQGAARSFRGWGIASPCLAEFWSVVTHPTCAGGPSTVDQAGGFLQQLVTSGDCQIWFPGTDFADRLIETAKAMGIQGVRIFDLQIALVALSGGAIEIWTHDAEFLTVPGLKVYDPL
jgi:hypothetical protein